MTVTLDRRVNGSRQTDTEAVEPSGGCPCRSHFGDLDPEHHEWLVTVERRGFAGAVDLMEYLELDHDCETLSGHLSWLDFVDFVACHNWQDPIRMHDLAEAMDRYLRSRDEARKSA